MSNPIDDALMAKEAFFGGLMQSIKNQFSRGGGEALGGHLMGGAQMALGGAAIAGIGAAASKIHDSITKKRDFKEMMSLNEDLQSEQQGQEKFFNAAYSSLRRMNPAFGKDPIVAGSYMRKMMANPDAAGLTLAQSVKAPMLPGAYQLSGKAAPWAAPMDEMNLAQARRREQMAPMEMERAQLGLKGLRRGEAGAAQKEQEDARQMSMFRK